MKITCLITVAILITSYTAHSAQEKLAQPAADAPLQQSKLLKQVNTPNTLISVIEETVEMLKEANGDVNATFEWSRGKTALHFAVLQDRYDIVRLLLGAKADLQAKDYSGETPLTLAQKIHKNGMSMSTCLILTYFENAMENEKKE